MSGENPHRPGFGLGQLRSLGKLAGQARELIGDYFHLADDGPRSIPAEVRTLAELEAGEIHPAGVLADLARYEWVDTRMGRKRDLYRVNLQDHNILRRVQARGVDLPPLLLYVLTHELVHVVRFVKFLAPFHQSGEEREAEERRVHAQTREILARVPLPGLGRILERYREFSG
jgi:hypothetical protein